MSNQELTEAVSKLRLLAHKVGSSDDHHFLEANAARNRGLDLASYWAGAIDGHHVSSAEFLNALHDISPEPKEEPCPVCGGTE